MTTEKKKVTKTIEHPLEDFLNVEKGSTEIVVSEVSSEKVDVETYDEKDNEIDDNFHEIYESALEAYENIQDRIEDCDPKHVARLNEVGLGALDLALKATSMKQRQKEHKDKMEVAKEKIVSSGGASIKGNNNNVIMTDRETLLKHIREENIKEVEGEIVEEDNEDLNEK